MVFGKRISTRALRKLKRLTQQILGLQADIFALVKVAITHDLSAEAHLRTLTEVRDDPEETGATRLNASQEI